jgi:ribosomal protein S18 acetylase RimI-like enzyme
MELMALLLKAVLVSTILLSTNAHHIEVDHEREKIDVIIEGLRDFNTPYFGNQKSIHFAVYLKNEKDEVVGGVLAWIRPGIKLLYIDSIWISEPMRNKGYGKKLMLAAEAEGKKHGCIHSQVDTLSFQAELFYQKLGYKRIGIVQKLYGEHDSIFMRKDLSKN